MNGLKPLTTGQVAKECQVAPATVAKWVDGGLIKGAYRIPSTVPGREGRQRRIPLVPLLNFLQEYGMPISDKLRRLAPSNYSFQEREVA